MPLLSTIGDLALVVLGFSLIIFIHELGHFAAARWAGVRVLAFALGFGPAVVSYRKGLGFRRGSSEKEYQELIQRDGAGASGIGGLGAGGAGKYERKAVEVSSTEYRLNTLPLGGYVKMLGQDDSDPTAVSEEADSFNRAPVYKRMIIISAGVAMNIVTAAILFIIVFSNGLKTESAKIGIVGSDSPASIATATVGGAQLKGLKPGDTILSVNGDTIEAFKDISLAVAMSRKGSPINVVVHREGFEDPVTFSATPAVDPGTNMLALGIGPAFSGTVKTENEREGTTRYAGLGAAGVKPGMTLSDAGGKALDYEWLSKAAEGSGGAAFKTFWLAPGSTTPTEIMVKPAMVMEEATVERDNSPITIDHLAGLVPVMSIRVVSEGSNAAKSGLQAGDIFMRLGDADWPSSDEGLRQIRAAGRQSIKVTVLRDGKIVEIGDVPITKERIGIEPATTAETSNLIARFPRGKVTVAGRVRAATPLPAEAADLSPGSRIVRVGVRETPTLREVRAAMQELISAGQSTIPLTVALVGPPGAEPKTAAYSLKLDETDAKAIAGLGWESPIPLQFFNPVEIVIQRSSPIAAVAKGMDETKKMVLTTYLTFARLFQGSVKVEHLKGPIGIATVGTQVADKGFIWLLFFMAAVSVNLAVVNFLPLPIVDGGHFCFLLWEQFTGKPVSAAVQNVAALAGLALIGAVFLMTTFNDLANLLWR